MDIEKKRLIAGILAFGSLWGFSECILGTLLHDANLPAGTIMTGFVAVGLMSLSRILFQQKGMQLGMGLVAGTLRLLDPFGGCFICSAFAIIAEGALFELIALKISFNLQDLTSKKIQVSIGIITAYTMYIGGYLITQILTPLLSSAGFSLRNLIVFIPSILARGFIAALLGGCILPMMVFVLQKQKLSIKDAFYYPATISISVVCWMSVIINALIHLSYCITCNMS
ncbi:MAG: hypothetical protein QXX20_03085 [Candidatus Thermoplasmatota archaeon]